MCSFVCLGARLTRVSDATLVEAMGRFHEVADRRMPIFGVVGIVGALASVAFSRVSRPWMLSAIAAQAPVNAELTRQARAGAVPANARALQARWDSVIVARVLLMGVALIALAGALVRSAQ